MFNPSLWTNSFQSAVQKASEMQKEGWTVETDDGALTSKQAAAVAKQAEQQGFETQLIPIADLDGDTAQFVAVKPRTAKTATPKAGSAPVVPDVISADELMNNFVRQHWAKGEVPDAANNDNGFLMDPNRTTAFVKRDAAPANEGVAKLVKGGQEAMQNPWGTVDREGYLAIYNAKKNLGKTSVELGPTGNATAVDINVLIKGLNTFGVNVGKDGATVKIVGSKDSPVYLGNDAGDMVLVAPAILEDNTTSDPGTITYNDALTAIRKQSP